MKRPLWQIGLLFLATFGLYALHWWPTRWKHIQTHRGPRLLAFALPLGLAFVPALGAGGWLGILASLAVLLHTQAAINREPGPTAGSFSLAEKVMLGLAAATAFFALVYTMAGPAAG